MKIVIASSGLGHVTRGVEAWAADLAHALATRGQDVTLCKGAGEPRHPYERVLPCLPRDAPRTRRLLRLPKRLTWRLGLHSGYGVEQTSFALRLLPHLRRERVELLHVQDPQVARIVQRAHRLGLVPTRTILAHGTEESPAFLTKFNYLQHLAPWHLQASRDAGAWRPTWTAIPNFIDTTRFHPGRADSLRAELQIPETAPVLLCVAAIKRRHKRIDHLLSEFSTFLQNHPKSAAHLIVAGGRESETDALVEEGRQKLGDRVRFLVSFPRERMPDLYRAADAFTLCSLAEMMPIALLEAMASGLPCLIHRHPVLEWICGPGGMAIDMQRPGALAEALPRLFADPTLSENERRHCVETFSTDSVVDEILAYYRFVRAA
jgi:glycosyltransferase involved in cell wall biosynthesis